MFLRLKVVKPRLLSRPLAEYLFRTVCQAFDIGALGIHPSIRPSVQESMHINGCPPPLLPTRSRTARRYAQAKARDRKNRRYVFLLIGYLGDFSDGYRSPPALPRLTPAAGSSWESLKASNWLESSCKLISRKTISGVDQGMSRALGMLGH